MDEAIAVTQLTLNTASADLLTASGTAIVDIDAANTAIVTDCSAGEKLIFFLTEQDGNGTATATFTAGDNPPSHLAGLGTLAISIPANDAVVVPIETAQFLQDDGTVEIVVTNQNILISVLRLPKGS
ncbi:MAG: hypothetical protein IIC06_01440 [Proteobacteria bacterium]|nr:hypothetical protein [Pseudomonadota bacterium]